MTIHREPHLERQTIISMLIKRKAFRSYLSAQACLFLLLLLFSARKSSYRQGSRIPNYRLNLCKNKWAKQQDAAHGFLATCARCPGEGKLLHCLILCKTQQHPKMPMFHWNGIDSKIPNYRLNLYKKNSTKQQDAAHGFLATCASSNANSVRS